MTLTAKSRGIVSHCGILLGPRIEVLTAATTYFFVKKPDFPIEQRLITVGLAQYYTVTIHPNRMVRHISPAKCPLSPSFVMRGGILTNKSS